MSDKVQLPLPCLVCAAPSEPAFEDADRWQPHGATMFTTDGHYGSTVFDEITGGRRLMLVVCDGCLRTHAEKLAVMTSWTPPPRHVFKQWNPAAEDES